MDNEWLNLIYLFSISAINIHTYKCIEKNVKQKWKRKETKASDSFSVALVRLIILISESKTHKSRRSHIHTQIHTTAIRQWINLFSDVKEWMREEERDSRIENRKQCARSNVIGVESGKGAKQRNCLYGLRSHRCIEYEIGLRVAHQ